MFEIVDEPWLFTGYNQPSTLSEVIGQGIGAGSACWSNLSGAGVFESERARGITVEIINWVEMNYVQVDRTGGRVPPSTPSIDHQPSMIVTDFNDGGDY